jgi:hypothetical protein
VALKVRKVWSRQAQARPRERSDCESVEAGVHVQIHQIIKVGNQENAVREVENQLDSRSISQ